MRAKLFAFITLIGAGAAGYTLLPYTPIPGYFDAFANRVSALAGFGAENIRNRVLPELESQLSSADLAIGTPVFIRVFNAERDLEIWLRGDKRYRLFKRVGFCPPNGDKTQTGFAGLGVYNITREGLVPNSPHHLEITLTPLTSGAPEDTREQGQTTPPAIYGNCEGSGSIALETSDIEPVFILIDTALRAGQSQVPVHIFEQHQNMDDALTLAEDAFESVPAPGLYDVYTAFERTRIPPEVHKTDGRYRVDAN
ncbi:hypothetical protein [Thalassospira alkalitolerans]|uniref:hypothetical protein n=1 Tax=Thalassospira alkalitolerans TaxID=1293890 RepID=UPI003AA8B906